MPTKKRNGSTQAGTTVSRQRQWHFRLHDSASRGTPLFKRLNSPSVATLKPGGLCRLLAWLALLLLSFVCALFLPNPPALTLLHHPSSPCLRHIKKSPWPYGEGARRLAGRTKQCESERQMAWSRIRMRARRM